MKSDALRKVFFLFAIYFITNIAISGEVMACEATSDGRGKGVLPDAEEKSINTCRTEICGDFSYFMKDVLRLGITTDLYSHYANPTYLNVENGNGFYNYNTNYWNEPMHAAAVDAHDYAGKTYDFLLSAFGYTYNQITEKKMISLVDAPSGKTYHHLGEGFVVFDTPTIAGYYKPSRAIDLVAHEFAHGISESSISGFRNYYEEPYETGALGESFSDAIGIAVKRANRQNWILDDWMVMKDRYPGLIKYFNINGDDCTQGTPGCREVTLSGRRNLANPLDNTRVRCVQPDYHRGDNWCVPSYETTGRHCSDYPCDRSHTNAGVPNKMFFLLSEGGVHDTSKITVQGLDTPKAIRILYEANRYYWPQYASMYQAMYGMISAAAALNADSCGSPNYDANDVRQVKLAWAAVGVGNRLDITTSGSGTVNRSSSYLPSAYNMNVYPPGDTVTLTAIPDVYSVFNGWYKDQCGWVYQGTGPYTATMDSHVSLMAEFIYSPSRTLTVSKTGTGSGAVTGTGINCGSSGTDCTEVYAHGANITLTATPSSGSTFVGWSGGCSGTGTCTVTMNAAVTVTATFVINNPCPTTTTTTYTDCTQCTGSNQSCVEGQYTWQYYSWETYEYYDCWECWDSGAECDDSVWPPVCWGYYLSGTSDRCTTTTTVCPPTCGNGSCESGETSASCPADCGSPPPPSGCGDGYCDCGSETPDNCPGDCWDWDEYWYYWEC